MIVIITPTKKMYRSIDFFEADSLPLMIDKTEILLSNLKKLNINELKRLLKCSDKIAINAYNNYQQLDLYKNIIPALFAYQGIQYEHMASHIFSNDDYKYIKNHLVILSGFYGFLRPFDGVVPYRLEMNSKLVMENYKSLYEFWGDEIYSKIDDNIILDLGAKQYQSLIKKYLNNKIYVKCVFEEQENNRYREVGVYVKIARGEMVRYLVENRVNDLNKVKDFNLLGYKFCKKRSNANKYCFVRNKIDN